MPMSAERTYEGEDIEAAPVRPLRADPGLDRGRETGGWVELAAENGARDRTIRELGSENADLYRRNAEQGKTIEQLQARTDRSEERFRAWAKEMANREDARAARDEARAKREEAMIDRIAELERRLAEKPGDDDPGGPERRVGGQEIARSEGGRRERGRGRASNEFIGIGAAVGVEVVTAVADPSGPSLLIGALGIVATGIPWMRKLREAGNDHRPRG